MLQTQINALSDLLKTWRWPNSLKLDLRRWLLLSTIVLLGCSSCASLTSSLSRSLAQPLEFRMNAVQAGDRPGLYQLSGQTNLPDKTQITVSAIRYLQKAGAVNATQPEATRVDPQKLSSYAILDRQFAQVRQGAWKTDLNLWQTADSQLQVGSPQADKPQEEWQLSLKDTNLKPLPEVVFLATVDPTQQPEGLQNQLDRLEVAQQLDLVRFTPDGEQYLQVSQTLAIPSPTAKAMTPVSDRTPQKVPVSQPNPASASDWKQISLPLSPDEFLQ